MAGGEAALIAGEIAAAAGAAEGAVAVGAAAFSLSELLPLIFI